ncbi:hypothetical protein ACHAXS_007433, partial [Conticribra weissflogii]
ERRRVDILHGEAQEIGEFDGDGFGGDVEDFFIIVFVIEVIFVEGIFEVIFVVFVVVVVAIRYRRIRWMSCWLLLLYFFLLPWLKNEMRCCMVLQ